MRSQKQEQSNCGKFGKLKCHGRCLLTKVPQTIIICCILHNICIIHSDELYESDDSTDASDDDDDYGHLPAGFGLGQNV